MGNKKPPLSSLPPATFEASQQTTSTLWHCNLSLTDRNLIDNAMNTSKVRRVIFIRGDLKKDLTVKKSKYANFLMTFYPTPYKKWIFHIEKLIIFSAIQNGNSNIFFLTLQLPSSLTDWISDSIIWSCLEPEKGYRTEMVTIEKWLQ